MMVLPQRFHDLRHLLTRIITTFAVIVFHDQLLQPSNTKSAKHHHSTFRLVIRHASSCGLHKPFFIPVTLPRQIPVALEHFAHHFICFKESPTLAPNRRILNPTIANEMRQFANGMAGGCSVLQVQNKHPGLAGTYFHFARRMILTLNGLVLGGGLKGSYFSSTK